MLGLFLIALLLITTPAWAWTKNYAVDPVPGASMYRLEKSLDLGVTWILAVPDSAAPAFTYNGTETGLVLFRISAINGLQVTTRTFDGLWHNEAWVVILPPPPPPPGATTVTFDNPMLPGSNGSFVNGVYQGIDFGTGQWRWSGPTGLFTTRSIYFAMPAGTSRVFIFPTPKTLVSFKILTQIVGTLTISDGIQTKTQVIPSGSVQTITTGWVQPSTTVTVNFTSGWVFNLDDISYK